MTQTVDPIQVMSGPETVFDADQHYYEPLDAFLRYLPAGWGERTVQVANIDGRIKLVLGGRIDQIYSNPLFDPIAKPGALVRFYRGNEDGRDIASYLADREALPAYYREPEARIKKLDEQDVANCWLLPTVALSVEESIQEDPAAAAVAFRAFNEWLLDDWTFNYRNRIFAPAFLTMGDIDRAVKTVEWALGKGTRLFVVRPEATFTYEGWRSPGAECFDPVWARLNEAGVTVIVHIGDVGSMGLQRYEHNYEVQTVYRPQSPLQIVMGHHRPITNYLAAIVSDRLFERFPNLRVASVENGADCLPMLLAGLKRAGEQRPGYFSSDPVEQFVEHVWMTPFWEDDLQQAVELMGADRVLFGSDWPHVEGLAAPRDYDQFASVLDEKSRRRVMYANTVELTGVRALVSQ